MKNQRSQRLAKNTLFLYIRMLLMMFVSFYTSRVILNALGITDFGIYNIVGGVVALFGIINAAMSSATQRFLNFELGKGDFYQLQRVFSMSLSIHITIALILLLTAETIGLYFVNTTLNIPQHKMIAANWVYQFSIFVLMLNIIRVPYNAIIIAYEKMSFYAYISIIEALFKLLIAFAILYIAYDKLISYAFLMFLISFLIFLLYKIICNRKFKASHYYYFWDSALFKKLFSFSSWSLLGSTTTISVTQGLNILINIFFGVAVNAAMGIANQVCGAVTSFVSNFQLALNPQIVKSYSLNDNEYLRKLLLYSSKYSFYILFIISLPILYNINQLLTLWLGKQPPYSETFIILMIVKMLINSLSGPLFTAIQATGNIALYQVSISSLLILSLPISYIFLKFGYPPSIVLYVSIVLDFFALFVRLFILKSKISFPLLQYLTILSRIIIVSILGSLLFYLHLDHYNYLDLCINFSLAFLYALVITLFLGMNRNDRSIIWRIIKNK